MVSATKRIVALTLAVLTLSASTTFSMGIHFCGGELESISVITAPQPCGMQKDLPPCHRQMTPSCCEDETIIHDGNEFSHSQSLSADLDFSTAKFIPEFTFLYDLTTDLSGNTAHVFHAPDPPPATVDRAVVFRSLLI